MKPIKQNILRVFGRDPETLDELAECVVAVINSLPNSKAWGEKKRKTTVNHRVAGFAWDIIYSDRVSNSHHSPEGLPQNFLGRDGVPRHYPGFEGRVWIRYAEEPNTWGSEPFEKTLTHTGTGGAGSYNGPWATVASARWQTYGHQQGAGMYPEIHCFSWDYRFYLADWPGIADWVEKQQLWSELSGKPWQRRHSFTWTDDEVLAADCEFIRNGAVVVTGELV